MAKNRFKTRQAKILMGAIRTYGHRSRDIAAAVKAHLSKAEMESTMEAILEMEREARVQEGIRRRTRA